MVMRGDGVRRAGRWLVRARMAGGLGSRKGFQGSDWARAALSLLAVAGGVVALVPVFALRAVPLSRQPFPDSATYANAAWELAHGAGYRTYVNQGLSGSARYLRTAVAPRYPFGTSAVLAPFVLVFGRGDGAQIGARVIVAAYVLAMLAAAWLLGGPLAALIAAILIRAAPFADTMATLVMSDPLAALLTVLVLLALVRGSKLALALGGALLGALIDVRLLGIVALPAALVARGRRRWIVLAGALPLIGLLAYYQWQTFGNPFKTGYTYWLPHLHQFGLGYIAGHSFGSDGSLIQPHATLLIGNLCNCNPMRQVSNLAFYPSVLVGLLWIYAPPLTGLIGLATLIRNRHTPQAQYALAVIVLNLATVLIYFWQTARFIAPAASLLLIYTAIGLATLTTRAIRHHAPGG